MKTIATIIFFISCLNTFGGEISDCFEKQIKNDPPSRLEKWTVKRQSHDYSGIQSTNHGITEIGIEISNPWIRCASCTFIVKSDGTFRYVGGSCAARVGEFTGKISPARFHRLARFIRDADYMNLQRSYEKEATDLITVFTSVEMNGKKKVICDYGNSGPTKLWAIEQLIEDLMDDAEWKPVRTSEIPKK